MVENGQKWLTIQICHIQNAEEAKKNPGTEPKTCEKGPKLGFEYLPTSKSSQCVRTACTACTACALRARHSPIITKYGVSSTATCPNGCTALALC